MLCLFERSERFSLREEYRAGLWVLRLGSPAGGWGARRAAGFLRRRTELTVLAREGAAPPAGVRLADTAALAASRAAELLLAGTRERGRVQVSLVRVGLWERRCLLHLARRVRELCVLAPEAGFLQAARLLAPLGISPLGAGEAGAAIRFPGGVPPAAPLVLDTVAPLPPGALLSPYPPGALPDGYAPLKFASYAISARALSPDLCPIAPFRLTGAGR
ncbi:MAG: hypothetical protein ACSW8F_06255 [bacterium]